MNQFWNSDKVGTLIISYYRSGTHFLQDAIHDACPFPTIVLGEICNDNLIQQLVEITETDSPYKLCILNNAEPKFYLTSADELLSKWHVVNLTRQDKLSHYISHWFWFQNTQHQRNFDSGKFRHHNTDHATYQSNLDKDNQSVPKNHVIQWLQEQLINYFIKYDLLIDYNDLINYETDNIHWQPNRYENIQLQDMIQNHEEITDLLLNFDLTLKN
jgi:hypothetical protein